MNHIEPRKTTVQSKALIRADVLRKDSMGRIFKYSGNRVTDFEKIGEKTVNIGKEFAAFDFNKPDMSEALDFATWSVVTNDRKTLILSTGIGLMLIYTRK